MEKLIKRICAECKKEFFSYLSSVKRGHGKFCSRSCFNSLRINNLKNAKNCLSPVERFFKNISNSFDPNKCWIWEGLKSKSGYGRIVVHKKEVIASRYSWELHNDKIPKGLQVCHHCDNPSCVNPDHLFLGTAKDNALDKMSKNRQPGIKGSKNSGSKLKEKDVFQIRKKLSLGIPGLELSKEFGVCPMTISNIKRCKSWKHIL